MSSERPEEFSLPPASRDRQTIDDRRGNEAAGNPGTPGNQGSSGSPTRDAATVLVRGETIRDQGDQESKPPTNNSPAPAKETSDDRRDGASAGNQNGSDDASRHEITVVVHGETLKEPEPKSQSKDSKPKEKEKAPGKKISEAKAKMQSRLPALDDDSELAVQKEQVVTRDGKADLAFTGTLLASAAPPSAPKGKWQENRIYETNGGKYVFSKVTRSVFAEEQDTHEAEIFDPSPSSVPSQLLRGARDLTRSRPLTWKDAAVDFFGYDELAKVLYRKLSGQFEEHVG
jgi:hypothetical protein